MPERKKKRGLTYIRIEADPIRKINRYVRRGMSKTEIINEALRQFLIEKELQEIREQVVPLAQAQGIYTEEDVRRLLQ